MKKRTIIPHEKIIVFNTRNVYFLKNKKVFRGSRFRNKGARNGGAKESSVDLSVGVDSIERVRTISYGCRDGLTSVLKRHGVEVL